MGGIIVSAAAGLPGIVRSTGTMLWNRTGSWRALRPRYAEKISPCSEACPVGEDIARIAFLVSKGAFEEAWLRIREENPFPAVCGRVCPRFCEAACNRGGFDEPVSFGSLEQWLADLSRSGSITPPRVEPRPTGKKVALVGAGPAGLAAAYFLRRLGHEVDLYDAREEPGGMLRYSIPTYRLDPEVLDWEIDLILSSGVNFLPGRRLGESLAWEDLAGYNAAFLAIGAWTPATLGIEGQELSRDGLGLLMSVRRGEHPRTRGPVAVIGGGNTSIDVARTLLRFGASPTIYYRRRLEDMPAFHIEVEEAMEEGISMETLLSPRRIEAVAGGNMRLTLAPMQVLEGDGGGRGRLVPFGAAALQVEVAAVYTAIGTNPSAGLPARIGDTSRTQAARGRISRVPSSDARMTSRPMFLGGDLIASRRTVADAIASGKEAAMTIDLELRGMKPAESLPLIRVGGKSALSLNLLERGDRIHRRNHVVRLEDIVLDDYRRSSRNENRCREPTARRADFEEARLPLTRREAEQEANRCFRCGICDDCDKCHLFCPEVAVIRRDGGGREIAYDYCKGCGVCVSECPRNAMTLEEEVR